MQVKPIRHVPFGCMKTLRALPDDFALWLTEAARQAGITRARFVRVELERARDASKRLFMALPGTIEGQPDL
jgi:hypothetical protein